MPRKRSLNTWRPGRTDLPSPRQILQVSSLCFGGNPPPIDRPVQILTRILLPPSHFLDSAGSSGAESAYIALCKRKFQRGGSTQLLLGGYHWLKQKPYKRVTSAKVRLQWNIPVGKSPCRSYWLTRMRPGWPGPSALMEGFGW